jgi:prolipoprotein diacylglyceryltransferase
MSTRATATFDVTGWDQDPYGEDVAPFLSRATVGKAFQGDLVGTSTAEVLMCQADRKDIAAGAGYIASEVVTGTLLGREGAFAMQHGGISEVGGATRTFGNIIPGTGTGGLEGLEGTVELQVDAQGGHSMVLEITLPD